MPDSGELTVGLARLARSLQARAAGLWRYRDDRLDLVHFEPADDLPQPVTLGFSEATRSVPITAEGLGIVRAASAGVAAISVAQELDPASGSGHWLRAFGASRSVAVPLHDGAGQLWGVVSVALPTRQTLSDVEIVQRLQNLAGGSATS